MTASQRDEVIRLALQAGIAASLFEGWEGGELALYPDTGGASASLEVAESIARDKAARRDWIVDLGNRAFGLPSAQGELWKRRLDDARIAYETGPQTIPYLKRTKWAVKMHYDILAELAKY